MSTQVDGIHLVLAATDPKDAMAEAHQVVGIQHAMGWTNEAVPTHTLRTGGLMEASGLVDLGYLLLAKNLSGKVVGFARVTTTGNSGEHFLHELGVLPDLQHAGLGKLLMEGVGGISLEKGASTLLFTYNSLNARNAYFYLHKCKVKGLRLLKNFYGVSSEGNSFSMLAKLELQKEPEEELEEEIAIEVVAEAAQFTGQPRFKVPVPAEMFSYIAFNHPLNRLIEALLMDLLANGDYRVTDYHRANKHFWVFCRSEEFLG